MIGQQRQKLLIRADGDSQIGLGHIYGSIRMARFLSKALDLDIVFRTRFNPVSIELLHRSGFDFSIQPDLEPADEIRKIIQLHPQYQGILYNFCKRDLDRYSESFDQFRESGMKLIFQDNPLPPSCHHADLLINALPHPEYPGYDPAAISACLDGLEYFLVDESLQKERTFTPEIQGEVSRILVAMGGSDADDLTSDVIKGLGMAGFQGSVDIVLGAANAKIAEVKNTLRDTGLKGEISRDVADLGRRMADADLGFSALGLTTYEMAYMGLPVVLLTRDPFNNMVAEGYSERYGAALTISGFAGEPERIASSFSKLNIDIPLRQEMSRKGVVSVATHISAIIESTSRILSHEGQVLN